MRGTTETDKTETDKTETDKTETDKTETDKTETDKTETDKTETDKTEKCGITLPISLVKQVDKTHGDIPRSTFIWRAVEQYMKWKSVSK